VITVVVQLTITGSLALEAGLLIGDRGLASLAGKKRER